MDDPHIVLRVHGYADDIAGDPMVWQWSGPQRVHFKHRRLDSALLRGGSLFKDARPDSRTDDSSYKHGAYQEISSHPVILSGTSVIHDGTFQVLRGGARARHSEKSLIAR